MIAITSRDQTNRLGSIFCSGENNLSGTIPSEVGSLVSLGLLLLGKFGTDPQVFN